MKKNILHIINKTRLENRSLKMCPRFFADGDAIILIENGVYNALPTTKNSSFFKKFNNLKQIYVLTEDVSARGITIDEDEKRFSLINYNVFVDLILDYPNNISWL